MKTSVSSYGRKFDLLIYVEAHAALAAPGDLEGDPTRRKAQERAVAEAAAEAFSQFCTMGASAPAILDAEVSLVDTDWPEGQVG